MATAEPSVLAAHDDAEPMGFWAQHRFFLLIIATIFISLVLVVVSMILYNVSGDSQLDLSRPGYQSVSNQVERGSDIEGFEASGTVTIEVIDEFLNLYDEQAAKATAVDAFNGDPLNPELLEFANTADE